MAADYVISTMYKADVRSALASLRSLEKKYKDIDVLRKSGAVGGSRSGGGMSTSIIPLGSKDSSASAMSFLKPAAALITFSAAIYGAVKGLKALVSTLDDFRISNNELQTRIRMQFPKEIAEGSVTYAGVERASMSINKQLTALANSMGSPIEEVRHSFNLFSSVLRETAGYSYEQALRFAAKYERSKPILAATTPSPETITRELTMLIASGTVDASTPLYSDIIQHMGSDPRMKGGVPGIRQLPVLERAKFVEDMMEKISSVVIKKVDTFEGQSNIAANNISLQTIQGLNGAFSAMLGIVKKVSDYTATADFAAIMSSLNNVIMSFISAMSSIVQIFTGSDSLPVNITAAGQALVFVMNTIAAVFHTLAATMYGLKEAVGLILNFIHRPAAMLTNNYGKGGAEYDLPMIAEYREKSNKSLQAAMSSFSSRGEKGLGLEGLIDSNGMPVLSDYMNDPELKYIMQKEGHVREKDMGLTKQGTSGSSREGAGVMQNNNITINIDRDIPPDFIAKSVEEALRKSAMSPHRASRASNPYAMAR